MSSLSVFGQEVQCETGRGYLGLGFTYQPGPIHGTLAVIGLTPGGPAARAGLQVGDRIREVNSTKFRFTEHTQILSAFDWVNPGQDIVFGITRDGVEATVAVRADCMSPSILQKLEVQKAFLGRMIVPEEEFRRNPEPYLAIIGKPLSVVWGPEGEPKPVGEQSVDEEVLEPIMKMLKEAGALNRFRQRLEPDDVVSILFEQPLKGAPPTIEFRRVTR